MEYRLGVMPAIRDVLPPLSDDEYQRLEDEILLQGCRDDIVVWDYEGVWTIVDGFARYEICKKHGLHFSKRFETFASVVDAQMWRIQQQLARRNMTTFERAELVLHLEEGIRLEARQHQASGIQAGGEPVNTGAVLAQLADTSRDTVRKVKVVLAEAPEYVKAQARVEKISINRAFNLAQEFSKSGHKTRAIAENYQVTEPDTIELIANMEREGRETVDEVLATGVIQVAEENETVSINDKPTRIVKTVEKKAREHRRQAFQAKYGEVLIDHVIVDARIDPAAGAIIIHDLDNTAVERLQALGNDRVLVFMAIPAEG